MSQTACDLTRRAGRRYPPKRARSLICRGVALRKRAATTLVADERTFVRNGRERGSKPEIGAAHFAVVGHVMGIAMDLDAAFREDVRIVTQCERQMDILLDQNDGEALLAEGLQREEQLLREDGGQPQRELVDHQDYGFLHQPTPHGEHLLL